jgi:hypothetical protein
MAKDVKSFATALATKDEILGFMVNLEKLKSDGSITAEQYAMGQDEYDGRLKATVAQIDRMKGGFRKELEAMQRELEAQRFEAGKLEARYKVGELTAEQYQSADRKLRDNIGRLEREAEELDRLIQAESAADVGVAAEKALAATVVPSPPETEGPAAEIAPPQESAAEPAPVSRGFLAQRFRLIALVAAVLLILSIRLPWVAPSELLGADLGAEPGMSVSLIAGTVGFLCGLVAVGITFLRSPRTRGTVHALLGAAVLATLAAVVATGDFPLMDETFRSLIVVREGLILYAVAALGLVVAGPLERKQR